MKKVLLIITLLATFIPVFSETVELDIDKAIELLHKNNMEIKATSFNVKIAKREKDTAWNALLPTLGVSAGTTLMDNPAYTSSTSIFDYTQPVSSTNPYTVNEPMGPDEPRFGFDLSISASLNINYALGAGIKNYRLQYEKGEISYETAVKGLEMNTKIQFYTLLHLEEKIKITKKGIDLAEKRYKQIQENYRNGLIPELDVLRTQVAYESQKPGYSNLQTQYENMVMGFKVMLGIDRNQDVILHGSLKTEIYTFNGEKLIDEYLAKSLNIKSLNKNLEILENSKKMSAQYAYTPILTLNYSLTPMSLKPWASDYASSTDSWNFQDDDGIGMGIFTIGLSMSLDNFIPGSKKNVELNNLKDQIKQMNVSLQQSVLKSEVDIINIIAKLENSAEQLEANRLNVELTKKTYEMTNEAYQLGTTELLDVESAENDLLSAEEKVLGEQVTYLKGLLNLEYTLNTSLREIIDNE